MTPKPINLNKLTQYEVTEDGKVWTHQKNRYLKGLTKPDGYTMYYLKDDDGNSRWYYVHRLVATKYHPNPNNKPDVDHIDNNRANNHKDNLQWVTEAENIQLSFVRDGKTMPRGKDHHNYGKTKADYNPKTIAKMSAKKLGENHPKFKGHYKYQDQLFASMNQLAKHLQTYTMTVRRMVDKGLIEFLPAA